MVIENHSLEAISVAAIKCRLKFSDKEVFSLFVLYGCHGLQKDGTYNSTTLKMWNYLKRQLHYHEKSLRDMVSRTLKTFSNPHRHRLSISNLKVLQSLALMFLEKYPNGGSDNDFWSEKLKQILSLLAEAEKSSSRKRKTPQKVSREEVRDVKMEHFITHDEIRQSLKNIRILVFWDDLKRKIEGADIQRIKRKSACDNLDYINNPQEFKNACDKILQ